MEKRSKSELEKVAVSLQRVQRALKSRQLRELIFTAIGKSRGLDQQTLNEFVKHRSRAQLLPKNLSIDGLKEHIDYLKDLTNTNIIPQSKIPGSNSEQLSRIFRSLVNRKAENKNIPFTNVKIPFTKTQLKLRPEAERVIPELDYLGRNREGSFIAPTGHVFDVSGLNDVENTRVFNVNQLYHPEVTSTGKPAIVQTASNFGINEPTRQIMEALDKVKGKIDAKKVREIATDLAKAQPTPEGTNEIVRRFEEAASMLPKSTYIKTQPAHPEVAALYGLRMGFKPIGGGHMVRQGGPMTVNRLREISKRFKTTTGDSLTRFGGKAKRLGKVQAGDEILRSLEGMDKSKFDVAYNWRLESPVELSQEAAEKLITPDRLKKWKEFRTALPKELGKGDDAAIALEDMHDMFKSYKGPSKDIASLPDFIANPQRAALSTHSAIRRGLRSMGLSGKTPIDKYMVDPSNIRRDALDAVKRVEKAKDKIKSIFSPKPSEAPIPVPA